ncbi:MAG: MATE family efflux transporter [Oscillospiraceae bacterium]
MMSTDLTRPQSRLSILWHLSWPAIIEQILSTMVSYVDTAMVGVLGANATAAVSINTTSIWLINGILTGIGVGFSVQISHAIGARDDEKARAVLRQTVLAVIVCGLVALGLFQILAGYIPLWLGAKPDVLPGAISYLRFYTLGMPFVAASIVFSSVLRCMGNTKAPLIFNTVANLINVFLNFFLIYETRSVNLGGVMVTMPGAGLGVAGAAIASAVAWAFAGIVTLFFSMRQGDRFRITRQQSFKPDKQILKEAVRLGLPSAIERATVNLGQIAMTRVVASIGTIALAANTIATTAEGLCYLPAFGISYAATALVGQSVGAKNKEDAEGYGSLSAIIGFILCVVTGALLFLLARPLASLFNSDLRVVEETAKVLRIVAFCEPFFAVSIILTGALRGVRDVRFPVGVSLVCMWGVRIVLAPIFVFGFQMGLSGVWLAMSIDLILRGLACIVRWKQGKWKHKCGFE